jgi:hypothetical protein
LAIDQHVFPSRSIERFAGEDGRVEAHLLRRGDRIIRRVKPSNPLFCADRAWDQRAETGNMKRIEDDFQKVVGPIIDGQASTVSTEDKPAIDRLFALWYWRSRLRALDAQEVHLNGIIGGDLSKEQEENLESNGYVFARKAGTMPARQLNGIVLETRINDYALELGTRATRWGVISTQSGEFIVPDVPMLAVIPLTPRLALVNSAPDGMITEQNLAQINTAMKAASRNYYFARSVANCPVF